MTNYRFSQEEWNSCIKVLKELRNNPFENPDNKLLSGLISKIYKKAKKQNVKEVKIKTNKIDLAALKNTFIAKNAINNTTLYSDKNRENSSNYYDLLKPKNCYACNSLYSKMHFFYGRMCPSCAEFNYDRRFDELDLSKSNVIITGARVKIGYAAALKLLRANANVIATSRFPAFALNQFMQEEDYSAWKDRLTVYGLDLRNLKAVEEFIQFFKANFTTLDVLINNAAQTIKYPDNHYLPISKGENQLLKQLSSSRLIKNTTPVLQQEKLLESSENLDDFEINRFGQPVDKRMKTSWNSTLEEISMYELLEVNLINQISPYFLIKELTPQFEKSNTKHKFIINVTSSEGQFSYNNKTMFHPHTNMTKAALNMMTRTAAMEYEKKNILMYAVDVGWISTGAIEPLRKTQFERGYIPPLDSVDGAARIMHPIYEALNKEPLPVGTLLKNYKVEQW